MATAYAKMADAYIAGVGRIELATDHDLALIGDWARSLNGQVIDVGCGPGQWTSWLSRQGVEIEGLDPVPEFIERAQRTYPETSYRVGTAQSLGVPSGSLGGILAWYSLIHSTPTEVDDALTEFARCIRPGGGLLLGFFAGEEYQPFPHPVSDAYFWPVDALATRVEAAGFAITHATTHEYVGVRLQGEIIAIRQGEAAN